jgi:peptidoglycan/xylan/chitin deacetylase (PgdA/CDA1 family)
MDRFEEDLFQLKKRRNPLWTETKKEGDNGFSVKRIIINALIVIAAAGVLIVNGILILNAMDNHSDPKKFTYGDKVNPYTNQTIDDIFSGVAGRIPILMYHNFITPTSAGQIGYISKGKMRYYVSSDEFRDQLELLYANNFRNISLDEYLSLMKGDKKTLDRLPPDCMLYVLTFDDATYGQFDFLGADKNGEPIIDPDCAVGIMIGFSKKHPDFKLNAAFCIDFENTPFLQNGYVEKKLNLLLDYGFELVNHTASHEYLANLYPDNKAKIDKEIGRAMELFESYLGYRARTIDKICYPGGFDSPEMYGYLKKITYNGKTYQFEAALDAEGLQAYNPNDTRFNPFDIARIEINAKDFKMFVLDAPGLYKTPPVLAFKKGNNGYIEKVFEFIPESVITGNAH